jgi:hypothetical protein
MTVAGTAAGEVDYAALVARHLENRLSFFPKEKIERILELAGMRKTNGLPTNVDGSPVDADSAFRYKKSVKDVLGEDAYTLTKLNFILAGCRCRDCRAGIGGAGPMIQVR